MNRDVRPLYLLLFTFCLWGSCAFASINPYPKIESLPVYGDNGDPLILTPMIEKGELKEARKAARVLPMEGDHGIVSYSGFFTVNKKYNSNLFFWYIPSFSNPRADPVVLWLQGGPGASSLFGLFSEHGPYSVSSSYTLLPRKYTWTRNHNMIYIDNPVATGFSFTNGGFAQNETAVGTDLYHALLQFFKLFPDLQKNNFFVTGESYGGKYVPAVSYAIHTNNKIAEQKINFQGMAIGNGLSDPEHMLKYGDYLYQLGLIDSNTRELFHEKENLTRQYIQEKQWGKAFDTFDILLNGDMTKQGTLFYNATGFTFYFNYLHSKDESKGGDLGKYVQMPKVRQAIHVGNSIFHDGSEVEQNLKNDVMQSVKSWVEELLEHYRVLIYNGQLDIIVAYPLTVSYLKTLDWSGTMEYQKAPRYQWMVGSDIAGYVKTAGNLTEILVRNAGHMAPSDQPKWTLDLINRFTSNKPYHLN